MFNVKLISTIDSRFDTADTGGMHEWLTDQMVRPAQALTRRIGSVRELVYAVRIAAHKGQIDRLLVMGHGLSTGDAILIGADVVSSGTVSMYAKYFTQLAGYFSPNGYAHFESCFIGMHSRKSVLAELAKMMGVRVYGGVGEENPLWHYNSDGYVVYYPDGHSRNCHRPQFGM